MATWLTYLKSKLLLPLDEEEEFKALEIAQRLKITIKKIRTYKILSDQMLKEKIGQRCFYERYEFKFKTNNISQYSLKLFDVLKSYATIISTKDFQKLIFLNYPSLLWRKQ